MTETAPTLRQRHAQTDSQDQQNGDKLAYMSMHSSLIESDQSLFTKLFTKKSALSQGIMQKYSSLWDHTKKPDENEDERLGKAQEMTEAYYHTVTDFYEYGWGQSFHFCRIFPGDTFEQALTRQEDWLAIKLDLKPGKTVLDIGCGVGGPGRELVRVSGCHTTGVNINEYQIERARMYAQRFGLENQTRYEVGDFCNMHMLDSNTFDAAVTFEATPHAPDLKLPYGEMFRLLKPGGLCGIFEWCTTENYDPSNEKHRQIIFGIETGNSIAKIRSTAEALEAAKSVGFEVIEEYDLAAEPGLVPWYTFLKPAYTPRGIARTPLGRLVTASLVSVLETLRIAPAGSAKAARILNVAADNLVAGGEEKIFTPNYWMLLRKPTSN
ncbi:uncharacterized protein VTP21DRAFT_6558 [Calcarisporiella thermophila]|uniref:uncharacterized protein n=1 Tax=Calcarisporiella thermophila TaxID=911321 RepID=UPI00374257B0